MKVSTVTSGLTIKITLDEEEEKDLLDFLQSLGPNEVLKIIPNCPQSRRNNVNTLLDQLVHTLEEAK